jgi:hypothetical protein
LDEMSQGRLKEELAHLRQNGLVESTPRDKGTNVERYQRNLQSGGRGNFPNNNRDRSNNNNRNRDRDNNRNRERDKFRNNKNNRKR